MSTNNNQLGAYYAGALRAAIASCFIGRRVSEQHIDFVKEVVLKFREAVIENSNISNIEKDELIKQYKQWIDATTHGIKDELRAEGKLG